MADTIQDALKTKVLEDLVVVKERPVVVEKQPTKAKVEAAIVLLKENKLEELGTGRFAREAGLTRKQVKKLRQAVDERVAELRPVETDLLEKVTK